MSAVYPFYYSRSRDVTYAEYKDIIPSDRLALTLSEVKQHLAISQCDSSSDIQLQTMIKAVMLQAEDLTGRTFLTTTYLTFREYFPVNFMLKESPVQSLTSVQYFLNGVLQTVPNTVYELTYAVDYPLIALLPGQSWPSNYDRKKQTIHITFVAGYGDNEASIPADLRIAMLNHLAWWWANRGDCSCDCKSSLPAASKIIYGDYQIKSFTDLAPIGCNYGFYNGWY